MLLLEAFAGVLPDAFIEGGREPHVEDVRRDGDATVTTGHADSRHGPMGRLDDGRSNEPGRNPADAIRIGGGAAS